MDLTLNDQQQEFKELADEFARKELAVRAFESDSSGKVPADFLQKIWTTGLLHPHLPADLGGMGLSLWDTAVIAEALAAGCSGIAAGAEFSAIAILPLIQGATEAQSTRFLTVLCEKASLAGLPLNLFALHYKAPLQARLTGSSIELEGEIEMMGNASGAEWFLVCAAEEVGHSLYLVPREQEGISIGEKRYLLGRRAADVRSVRFKKVRIDKDCLLGRSGEGSKLLDATRPACFTLLAAATVGIARNAMEHAIAYSKERRTFGKPISEHQAVSFILADMAKDTSCARLLTWQSAALYDQGSTNLHYASVARIFAQESAMRIAIDAVQVYGGYGYSREYPVEKLMRDAKIYQLYDGTIPELKTILGQQLVSVGAC